MKKSLVAPIIFTLFLLLQLTQQQCIYTAPLTMSSLDRCTGQVPFDNTQSFFPSQWTGTGSTKTFSFDLQIQIIGEICPSATDQTLFMIMLDPANGSGPLLTFYYSDYGSGVLYNVDYTDYTTSGTLLGDDARFPIEINTDFELLGTIDLTAQKMKGYLAFREKVIQNDISIDVDTNWQFDKNTQILICASLGGNPSHYCSITSFNYWFTNPNDFLTYPGSLSPVLLAKYPFNEGSGYKVGDYATLGTAYLSDSTATTSDKTHSPKWLSSEAGIEFTEDEQFVNVKPFKIPKQSDYDLGSFTITFWIKWAQPGVGGNVFSYLNYDMSVEFFGLQLLNDGSLVAGINYNGVTSTSSISSTDWSFVAVTYALHPINTEHHIVIFIDGNYASAQAIPYYSPLFVYSSQNKFRIGGPGTFKGSLADFRIYSPGSTAFISKGTCQDSSLSTNCLISLGKLTDNQCLTQPTITCHSTCKTCFDTTANSCLSCYPNYHISSSQCISDSPALSQATTEAIKGGQTSALAVTQVVNAVAAGSPMGISAAIGGKIFFNIKFINITYSEKLEEALTSWGSNFISLGLTPDLPSSIKDQIPDEEVPYIFQKREIPSSFIENLWESLGVILLVTFIFAGVFTLECAVKKFKYKYLPHQLIFAARATVQNFLLAQLYSVFGDILFFAAIEFRSPNTHYKWSRLSLATSIILLLIMFIILGYHMHLLLKYQYLRRENITDALAHFENENKGSQVLFNDFKEKSLARQSFLLLLTGRDLIFSFFIALMFDHPLAECIFILVLNLAMVAYLLLLPPFKSIFDATQQLFYEIITLAVNVSILILTIMDGIDSPDDDNFKSRIGQFIIIVNLIFNFGSLAFMLFKTFQTLYEIYKEYRAKKSLQKVYPQCETSDFLVTNPNLTQQEILPKISIDIFKNKEPIEFEFDTKPEDQTNESALIQKVSPSEAHKNTPKLEETIQDSLENSNQFTHQLNQTEENNPLDNVASIDDQNDDDKAEALKTILEKNKHTRMEIRFQAKLKESSMKIRNSRTNQTEDSPFDFGEDELRSSQK